MSIPAVIAQAVLAAAAPAPSNASVGWTMVWSDEFNGSRIDRQKWQFDVDCWGGGNEERQCYTDSLRNAAIEDGKLIITARHERVTGPALPKHLRWRGAAGDGTATRDFSSARLTTRGRASWRYGRIEVRAALPQGQGTWPAIWMLPEKATYGPWAASGEIDILEAVNLGVPCPKCPGGKENTVLGTLHFGAEWPNNKQASTEIPFPDVLDNNLHTFAIEWSPDRMIWSIDGKPYAQRLAAEWSTTGSKSPGAPFDQPFHLVINLAIGGKFPESRGLGGVRLDGYPKRLEIDWVRVWNNERPVANSDRGRK